MVVCFCNPNTWEVDAKGSLPVLGYSFEFQASLGHSIKGGGGSKTKKANKLYVEKSIF